MTSTNTEPTMARDEVPLEDWTYDELIAEVRRLTLMNESLVARLSRISALAETILSQADHVVLR